MSLLIKGMEMPKNCDECPFDNDVWCLIYPQSMNMIYDIADGKPDWCPLVEIPPHGRLIDENNLITKAYDRAEKCGDMVNVLDKVISTYDIRTAPTIIEAEE